MRHVHGCESPTRRRVALGAGVALASLAGCAMRGSQERPLRVGALFAGRISVLAPSLA